MTSPVNSHYLGIKRIIKCLKFGNDIITICPISFYGLGGSGYRNSRHLVIHDPILFQIQLLIPLLILLLLLLLLLLFICILYSSTEKAFLLVYYPVKLLTAVASQQTPGVFLEFKLPQY